MWGAGYADAVQIGSRFPITYYWRLVASVAINLLIFQHMSIVLFDRFDIRTSTLVSIKTLNMPNTSK